MSRPRSVLYFDTVSGFQWDAGNLKKNEDKHGVDYRECEEIFFNQPLIVQVDEAHSKTEQRYYALGKTDSGRGLFIVFTIREDKIRVISARNQHKKERSLYEAA